jgi:hypothetical protein
MEYFNERYGELAASLSSDLEDIKLGRKVDATELATVWTANNDARGYAVIGDPAVRLRVNAGRGRTAPLRESLTLSLTTQTDLVADDTRLDRTLEKLEQQVNALAETIRELRAALKNKP